MISESIYLGRDNENILNISSGDAAADLSGITRMLMKFKGSDVVVDSDLDNESITWNAQGQVILRLGELDIPASRYFVTLIAFDPEHDDGQVLFHADEGTVQFWFLAP